MDFTDLEFVRKKAKASCLIQNLKIKQGLELLKEIELEEESYWVYSRMGRSFYEINEYLEAERYCTIV